MKDMHDFTPSEISLLKHEFKKDAVRHGLCRSWQKMLDHCTDAETFVQLYMKGINFCFRYNFPDLSRIALFKGVSEKYGLFVNENAELKNVRKIAFVGECHAEVCYDDYEVGQVYIKDKSSVTLQASDHAFVTIDCFDKSILSVKAVDFAKVTVNKYKGARVNGITDKTGIIHIVEHPYTTYNIINKINY